MIRPTPLHAPAAERAGLQIAVMLLVLLAVGCADDDPARRIPTPPAAVQDLAVADHDSTALLLTWSAPGKDEPEGRVGRYDLRFAAGDSMAWEGMTGVVGLPAPRTAGAPESVWVRGLARDVRYSFLLAAADEDSSWSTLSNRASGTTGAHDRTAPGGFSVRYVRATATSITITFTAPGDDGPHGIASRYEAQARPWQGLDLWHALTISSTPQAAGTIELLTLDGFGPASSYRLQVRAVDGESNAGPWSEADAALTAVEIDTHWWEGFAPALGRGVDGRILALAVSHDLLVAGGRFNHAGSVAARGLAAWNGTSWITLGSGVAGGGNAEVRCLLATDGLLYAGGDFATMDGFETGGLAVWDGTRWSAPGVGLEGVVSHLAIHEGDLYATGSLRLTSGGVAATIARRHDGVWQALPDILDVESVSLASFQGVLYAGVYPWAYEYGAAVDVYRLEEDRWKPAMFAPAHGYIPEYCCDGVLSLTVLGSLLWAVGPGVNFFGEAGIYDGDRWASRRMSLAGVEEGRATVNCVSELHGDPVVGGWFNLETSTYPGGVAIWKAGNWEPLGSGIGLARYYYWGPDGGVAALAEYGGDLYAGGAFQYAGRKPSSNIARWIP